MVAGMNRLELFVGRDRLKPFVINELAERIHNPIIFVTPTGGRAQGYDAEILVELCEAVLAARAAGVLQTQQLPIAQSCEIVMRGLARVGIVALVDEVTGYQEVRKRDALNRILEAYIAPELMPWTKRFPTASMRKCSAFMGGIMTRNRLPARESLASTPTPTSMTSCPLEFLRNCGR